MSEKLLPPRAKRWTRAAAYTFDTAGRISYATQKIGLIGITDFPEDWLPWLVYEFGLEDVVPYVRTMKQALIEGRVWQKRRGTPDGIRIGIGWVESEGVVAPPDGRHKWWEFQVAFTDPPESMQQIRQLFGIINLSKASEDELFRMYSPEYDHRPARMDQHRFDEGNLMDDYSGAPRWNGGPYISFGRNKSVVVDYGMESTSATTIKSTRVLNWFDGRSFDVDRFGSRPLPIWDCQTSIETTRAVDTSSFEDTWGMVWKDKPWGENGDLEAFVAQTREDRSTVVSTYKDDVWGETYPDESWESSAGSQPVPTNAETT